MSWVVEVRSGYGRVLLAAINKPDAEKYAEAIRSYFAPDFVITQVLAVYGPGQLTLGEARALLELDKASAAS